MRFAVPQFIEVEDKIFGPLTIKQAIFIAGWIGVVIIALSRFGIFVAVLIGTPVGILAFALSFAKVNDQPFTAVLYAAVFYYVRTKLYLWKKLPKKIQQAPMEQAPQNTQPVAPKLSQSRLKELAWSLDTHDSLYTNEKQWKR